MNVCFCVFPEEHLVFLSPWSSRLTEWCISMPAASSTACLWLCMCKCVHTCLQCIHLKVRLLWYSYEAFLLYLIRCWKVCNTRLWYVFKEWTGPFFHLKWRKNQAFISILIDVSQFLLFDVNAGLTRPLCVCFTLRHFQQSRENSSFPFLGSFYCGRSAGSVEFQHNNCTGKVQQSRLNHN